MIAGVLANSGYFTGDDYVNPRHSNPLGFFEDSQVNAINEDIMAEVLKMQPQGLRRRWPVHRRRFRRGQMWLADLPVGTRLQVPPGVEQRIKKTLASGTPYCLKDPRFCYTLPVWRPHLGEDVVYICIFREPWRTAESIVREVESADYLSNLKVDPTRALGVWKAMYGHVLESHRYDGEWLFVHFDQVLEFSAFPRLEEALGARLARSSPDAALRRSVSDASVEDAEAVRMYAELCRLAGF